MSLKVWQSGSSLVCTLPLVVSKKYSWKSVLLNSKGFSISLKLNSCLLPLRQKNMNHIQDQIFVSLGPKYSICVLYRNAVLLTIFSARSKGGSSQWSPLVFKWTYCTWHKYWLLRLLWKFTHSCLGDESWKSTKRELYLKRELHFTFPLN